jgi:catechol 2,3-dioxygenase-like lactoylglutathione lyase family enzyme
MKRLHVHVTVADLDKAIGFYGKLFAAEPTVRKDDYAKWRLDDPVVNFAISSRGRATGVNHLGIEVEDEQSLQEIETRLAEAEAEVVAQRGASCCYAKSDKAWSTDPDGVVWESFVSHNLIDDFGDDTLEKAIALHDGAAA